jgi:hypothetical protein
VQDICTSGDICSQNNGINSVCHHDTKIYILEQSKPEQHRNEMQVALHMLQRTTCADGKPMITDSVLHWAQSLLITGVNSVPSIETLQKTIRRAKNVAENLKEPMIQLLQSNFLVDDGEAQTSKLSRKSDSSSEAEEELSRHLQRGLSLKKSRQKRIFSLWNRY